MVFKRGTVITNCEDDEDGLWRVKVNIPGVWETSAFLPSVGPIYLDKGDEVLILMEDMTNPVILGRINVRPQMDKVNKSKDGPLLYQAVKDDEWMEAHCLHNELKITTSKGYSIKVTLEDIEIEKKTITTHTKENTTVKADQDATVEATQKLTLKGDEVIVSGGSKVTIESPDITVKGSMITIDGHTQYKNPVGPPDGTGPLCGIPYCLFSGAPHSSKQTG